MTQPAWVSDLFAEKSLWQTFRLSLRFPSTTFSKRLRRFAYIAVPLVLFSGSVGLLSVDESLRAIDSASQIISTVAATIIGFLVAGLTIFTTLSDRKILVVMAETRQRGTEVSCFKYLFYNLLNVFVVYIIVLCVSAVIQIFSNVAFHVSNFDAFGIVFPIAGMVNALAISLLSIIAFESVITLKNFIWNIYATFISVLTVSALMDESK